MRIGQSHDAVCVHGRRGHIKIARNVLHARDGDRLLQDNVLVPCARTGVEARGVVRVHSAPDVAAVAKQEIL